MLLVSIQSCCGSPTLSLATNLQRVCVQSRPSRRAIPKTEHHFDWSASVLCVFDPCVDVCTPVYSGENRRLSHKGKSCKPCFKPTKWRRLGSIPLQKTQSRRRIGLAIRDGARSGIMQDHVQAKERHIVNGYGKSKRA
jgi:hypothetical protein